MDEELAAALAAFLVAVAALLRDELARRRVERVQHEHAKRLVDVQRKVGADRRPGDRE